MWRICETCAHSAWRDGKTAVTEVCLICTFGKDGQPTNWKEKTMTNADRIRAMSDEELAEWISDMAYGRTPPWSEPFERKFCDNCPTVHCTYENGKEDDFRECDFVDGECPHGSDIVWWLKQPAEEADDEP